MVRIHVIVDTHRGEASLRQGLLRVEFPKIEERRRRGRVVTVEQIEESAE